MNLPASFIKQTSLLMGEEEYKKLDEALNQEAPVSIRLNKAKISSERYDFSFCGEFVPWCMDGHYLDRRLTFTFDPLFHAGCYYVQEASSMFVEQIIRKYVTEPSVMLDLCAAPGGKSTHARSVLPVGSLLVANEVIRNRSQILAENLIKWGYPDVVVTNNDPTDFASLESFFDVILADVPCSGEGMFRKDPASVQEWSPENVDICYQRQRRIINDIWKSLKPGGILIYSTCTYNTKEDEENIAWIRHEYEAESLSVDVLPEWNLTSNLMNEEFPVYRFLPHKTKGEGFFLAALRKPFDAEEEKYTIPRKKTDKKGKKEKMPEVPSQAKEWLSAPDKYFFEVCGSNVIAFAKEHADKLTALRTSLRIVHAGITIGELRGKDFFPDHSLAMSSELNRSAFFAVEVTYEQAIAYLRKEAISLDETTPRGYILLLYKGIPIGFVKNIGNRANNLYPQEWRIRSGYLPEEIRCLFL